MSETERVLALAHSRAAEAVGRLSLALSRRSVSRGLVAFCIRRLRESADTLEKGLGDREKTDVAGARGESVRRSG